ncbi:MAG: putative CRISPR-associated protein [Nitrospirota bacterium]
MAKMDTLYLCPIGVSILGYLGKQRLLDDTVKDKERVIREFLKDKDDTILMKASAEINSLFRMGITKGDRIVFLASDTDDGEIIADILSKILKERRQCATSVKRIKGLQIDDRKRFEHEGIPELTETIVNEYDTYHYQFDIVLNATAGFKATIPYLTFIGMVFNLPIRYIFEWSESIIELPPIPIDFDIERLTRLEPVIDEIISDYIPISEFQKRMAISYEDLQEYLKDILIEEDRFITLRPTGRILYQRYLQIKGNRIYISPKVKKKLSSGSSLNRDKFEALFKKMRDPVHLKDKLHPEIKRKGEIDLECYKQGATSERIFFYTREKGVYICDIDMHDEYERAIKRGERLLIERFEQKEMEFEEILP